MSFDLSNDNQRCDKQVVVIAFKQWIFAHKIKPFYIELERQNKQNKYGFSESNISQEFVIIVSVVD